MPKVNPVDRFEEIVMGLYDEFFAPEGDDPHEPNMRQYAVNIAVNLCLYKINPVEVAENFELAVKKRHGRNQLDIFKPFNIHLYNYVSKYKAGLHGDKKKNNKDADSADKNIPLKDLSEEDQIKGLTDIFVSLISLPRAPVTDDGIKSVAKRYAGILGDLSLNDINARIDIVLQRSRYFPVPSEILSATTIEKPMGRIESMKPPAADPDCECVRGWILIENEGRRYHEACELCDLGKFYKTERR